MEQIKKIKLELAPIETVKFDFYGNNIEVRTVLTLSEQNELMNQYVYQYFAPMRDLMSVKITQYDYLGAEQGLIGWIIENLTNVQIFDEDDQIAIDLDTLYSRGLWQEVRERIANYEEFRYKLDRVVKDYLHDRTVEKYTGAVLDDLYHKIADFLKEISSMDAEKIAAIKQSMQDLLKEAAESPLAGLMQEAKKQPVRRKKKAQ